MASSGQCLAGRRLIPPSSIGDEHLLMDDQYHAHDIALMRTIGVRRSLGDPKMPALEARTSYGRKRGHSHFDSVQERSCNF